jgi:hypothetical protein
VDAISSTVPLMAADRRVLRALLAWILSFLLIFVMAVAAILWTAIGHVNPSTNDFVAGVFVIAGAVWFATVMGLYFRYYRTFISAALRVPDGVSRAELPRVVEASSPLQGEVFARRARVKTVLGWSVKCRIELYPKGIRIWRGPEHEEPSFSFLYKDLLQAEMATIVVGRGPDVTYVRLVARQPRMAFLISSGRSSRELVRYLGAHDVPTFGV